MLSACSGPLAAAQTLPPGFVYLREIEPSIAQDIRYAGADNFTGRALPGYEAAECVLREEAARALAAAYNELARQGLGLKVFDCYRPMRAVTAMLSWVGQGAAAETDKRFYPHVARGALVAQGYIGAHSQHSTGLAVDLTIIGSTASPAPPKGPCRGFLDGGLDMGTSFDCFDPASWTDAPGVSAEAKRNRMSLADLMRRHGFAGYRREWWHFSFGAGPASSFDFPIPAPPSR